MAAFIDPRDGDLPAGDRLLRGVLSGALDMDKLDYLPRDARACNVPYGGVDSPRLIDALTVVRIPGSEHETELRVGIREKGISPLHSLINARQEMFDNVYWHHTNRACMAMLLRAVQEALLAGALRPDELTRARRRLAPGSPRSGHRCRPSRARLARALRDRRIHKRAVEIGSRAFELYARLGNLYFDPGARREVESPPRVGAGQ